MFSKPIKAFLSTTALATVLMAHAPLSEAFNFGNMMNPSRWMGSDRYDNRYDDPYWGGPPYGGGYGYPGVYGSPYGVPYAAPGFGGVPAPGYGAPGYGAVPAPAQGSRDSSEVEALKRRIEELEARQQQTQPQPRSDDWPSAPAFRPMDQY